MFVVKKAFVYVLHLETAPTKVEIRTHIPNVLIQLDQIVFIKNN